MPPLPGSDLISWWSEMVSAATYLPETLWAPLWRGVTCHVLLQIVGISLYVLSPLERWSPWRERAQAGIPAPSWPKCAALSTGLNLCNGNDNTCTIKVLWRHNVCKRQIARPKKMLHKYVEWMNTGSNEHMSLSFHQWVKAVTVCKIPLWGKRCQSHASAGLTARPFPAEPA